jgi:FkbM family methyltransferase
MSTCDAIRDYGKVDKRQARRDAARALTAAGRNPVHPIEFRSQFGEDALAWALFDGKLDGFFIEAGAFDGYHFAATYALECIGWTGLLVEAIPERAEECRARRPRSRVVHAALGATTAGEAAFTITADEHGGMFSHLHGTDTHKKKALTLDRREVRVPITTLDHLLETDRGNVDFAVIDVEGSEPALLEGFDLRKHQPKVLMIEDNARGADSWLSDYMRTQPYTQVAWLRVNRVYVRSDLAPMWIERLPPV